MVWCDAGNIDSEFIGKMLDVLWPDDGKWYPARVTEVNVRAKKVKIEYDEGTDEGPQEWIKLANFREGTHWRFQDICMFSLCLHVVRLQRDVDGTANSVFGRRD